MPDLYSLSAEGAEFTKYCGGNLGGEHETCIRIAQIPGTADGFLLQDSKPEGQGRELRVTGEELNAFIIGAAEHRGLKLG
ncbi:DUF397 domain-containing protein [Streptomyces sp. NPDC020096]